MMRPLFTPRLILRPLGMGDAPAIQNTFPQWEIVQWLDAVIPWPYPDDGAQYFLENVVLPGMEKGTAWHWSIRPRDQVDLLIGVISLRENEDDNRGFWLDPAWHGRGIMSEASNVVTGFWFETLGKEILRVPKAVMNGASRRISEKQGMRVVSRFHKALISGTHEMELWEISRDEWRAHAGLRGY